MSGKDEIEEIKWGKKKWKKMDKNERKDWER